MKKIYLILSVSVASIMISQEKATYSNMASDSALKGKKYAILPFNSDNKICYSGVVEISNKTKEKLYDNTKEFVILNYTSKDFPTILDEKNERIYLKGKFKVPLKKFLNKKWYDLVYTAKFYFKDGKYKYEITDLYITINTKAKVNGSYWWYGYSSTITESQVVKRDMEDVYAVKRYTSKFSSICWKVDDGIKAELAKYEKYMKEEHDQKKW